MFILIPVSPSNGNSSILNFPLYLLVFSTYYEISKSLSLFIDYKFMLSYYSLKALGLAKLSALVFWPPNITPDEETY